MSLRRPAGALTAGVVLVASLLLTGCGEDAGEDPEALCSAVDDLKASVAAVADVEVTPGALAAIQEDLGQVQTDADAVRDEATDEFADELDLVDKAAASAGLAIDFAVTEPSAETVAAVVPALQLLGERLVDLTEAVEGTC